MKVQVFNGEAKAAVARDQKPEYVGTLMTYTTDAARRPCAVVQSDKGFLELKSLDSLMVVPAPVVPEVKPAPTKPAPAKVNKKSD